jgi:hypothetical protein
MYGWLGNRGELRTCANADAHTRTDLQKLERVQVAFLNIEIRVVLGSNCLRRGMRAW